MDRSYCRSYFVVLLGVMQNMQEYNAVQQLQQKSKSRTIAKFCYKNIVIYTKRWSSDVYKICDLFLAGIIVFLQ